MIRNLVPIAVLMLLMVSVAGAAAQGDSTIRHNADTFSVETPRTWAVFPEEGSFAAFSSIDTQWLNNGIPGPDDALIVIGALDTSALADGSELDLNAPLENIIDDLGQNIMQSVQDDNVFPAFVLESLEIVDLDDGRSYGIGQGRDSNGTVTQFAILDLTDGQRLIVYGIASSTMASTDFFRPILESIQPRRTDESADESPVRIRWHVDTADANLGRSMTLIDGQLYVAARADGVAIYDLQGEQIDTLTSDALAFDGFTVTEVVAAPDNTLWLVDGTTNRAAHVTMAGEVLNVLDTPTGLIGLGAATLDVDSNGTLMMAFGIEAGNCENGSARGFGFVVLTPDGAVINEFEVCTDREDILTAWDLDAGGNIHAATATNGIVIYAQDGTLIEESVAVGEFFNAFPGFLYIPANGGYVTYINALEGAQRDSLVFLDNDGAEMLRLSAADFAFDEFFAPSALVELADGSFIMLEDNIAGSRITHFSVDFE